MFKTKFTVLTATIAVVVCAAVYSFTGNNSALPKTQINFIENSWADAIKQAQTQHKYIFVDAYATWCGPRKMLKAQTFTDAKAADFFNKNFVNVAIDMERGVGPNLASQWNIQAYPTLIVCNPDGKPVYGSIGFIGAADLIKFGREGLKK